MEIVLDATLGLLCVLHLNTSFYVRSVYHGLNCNISIKIIHSEEKNP